MKLVLKNIYFYPLNIYLIVGFVGVHPFTSSKTTVIEYTSDINRQIIYLSLYLVPFLTLLIRKINVGRMLHAWNIYFFALFYIALSMTWSDFPVKVLKDLLHLSGMLLLVNVLLMYERYPNMISNVVFLVTSFINLTSILVVLLLPEFGIHHLIDRWKGICMHPNYLGISSMLCIITACYHIITRDRSNTIWISLFLIILSLITLIYSDSKTSLVITFFAILVYLFHLLSNRFHATSLLQLVVNGFIVVAIISCLLFLIDYKFMDSEYYLSLLNRSSDLSGRTYLWALAWKAIKASPYFGWGFDGLLSAQKNVFHYTLDRSQLHNGYLDFLVRLGICGSLLLIIILCQTFKNIYHYYKKNHLEALYFFLILMAIIMHNVTEASIFVATHPLWALFCMVFFFTSFMRETGVHDYHTIQENLGHYCDSSCS